MTHADRPGNPSMGSSGGGLITWRKENYIVHKWSHTGHHHFETVSHIHSRNFSGGRRRIERETQGLVDNLTPVRSKARGGNSRGNRMRGLSLLIRLARHDLEERRSDLGCIARAQMDTGTEIEALDEAVLCETDVVMTDPSTITVFGAWAAHSARGRSRLQAGFEELGASADTAREVVRDTVAQVRRLEIVLDTKRTEARRLLARRAENNADERELVRYASLRSG